MSIPPKVFILAPHLGVIHRGFESSSLAIFEALKDSPQIDLHLLRAARASKCKNDHVVGSLTVGSWSNYFISWLFSRDEKLLAQDTFLLGLLAQLVFCRPRLLVVQDRHLANRLYHVKKILGLPYKIYFINGGPFLPPFHRFDHVQHLTEFHYEQSLAAGDAKEKISLIPYGERISKDFAPPLPKDKSKLRDQLGLPVDRPILLSVAALNKGHKRIDYLIDEVAALPKDQRPFLAMLGVREEETPELGRQALAKLGADGFLMRQVAFADIGDYYETCDLFVLSSIQEGFGRVFIEALSHGMPCLAHDYPVARFALGPWGMYADFTQRGALNKLLSDTLKELPCQAGYATERHAWAYKKYSWDVLSQLYLKSFLKVINT